MHNVASFETDHFSNSGLRLKPNLHIEKYSTELFLQNLILTKFRLSFLSKMTKLSFWFEIGGIISFLRKMV